MEHKLKVFWSEKDNCYIAQSLEWESLSAFGDSIIEALTEFGNALETALED